MGGRGPEGLRAGHGATAQYGYDQGASVIGEGERPRSSGSNRGNGQASNDSGHGRDGSNERRGDSGQNRAEQQQHSLERPPKRLLSDNSGDQVTRGSSDPRPPAQSAPSGPPVFTAPKAKPMNRVARQAHAARTQQAQDDRPVPAQSPSGVANAHVGPPSVPTGAGAQYGDGDEPKPKKQATGWGGSAKPKKKARW
jgi:hypothetical protein